MGTYRYSQRGADALSRAAFRQSLIATSIAMLAGFGIVLANGGTRGLPQIAAGFVVIAGVQFVVLRQSRLKTSRMVQSTEITVDSEGVTCSNAIGTISIPRNEITELRHLKDGVLLRGKSLQGSVLLKPELHRYDDLLAEIQNLVPDEAKRVKSAKSTPTIVLSLVIGNLVLLCLAFTLEYRPAAIPLCAMEAIVLFACIVWVWQSKMAPRRLKWMMLVALLPIMSLLGRAYLLLSAR